MDIKRIIYLVILMACTVLMLYAAVPHAVVGTIRYADASFPDRISWEAHITSRPEEIIEFSPLSLYDSLTGGFMIQCGGFSSWSAAESLHVDFFDNRNAFASANIVLSYNPYDDAGEIILKTPDALEEDKSIKPQDTELYQNYPNPFNPETVISFRLEKSQFVSLKIYNSAGQSVYAFPEEFKNSGLHQLVWNGRDDTGRLVASGIYVYALETENLTKHLKAVFIR